MGMQTMWNLSLKQIVVEVYRWIIDCLLKEIARKICKFIGKNLISRRHMLSPIYKDRSLGSLFTKRAPSSCNYKVCLKEWVRYRNISSWNEWNICECSPGRFWYGLLSTDYCWRWQPKGENEVSTCRENAL